MVPPSLQWLYGAYQELSTCRPSGGMGGPAPIPWTAIREYAAAHGIGDHRYLTGIIRRMDEAFMSHAKEKREKEGRRGG